MGEKEENEHIYDRKRGENLLSSPSRVLIAFLSQQKKP
jgi:hypothetical protein